MLVLTSIKASVAAAAVRGVDPSHLHRYSGTAFACFDGSGSFTSAYVVNDDYCDCADGSDEPGTSACAQSSDSRFFCTNERSISKLIYSSRVQDGVCDCCDGTDEQSGSCPNSCEQEGVTFFAQQQQRKQDVEQGLQLMEDGKKGAAAAIAGWRQQLSDLEASVPGLAEEERLANEAADALQRHVDKEKDEREERKRCEEAAASPFGCRVRLFGDDGFSGWSSSFVPGRFDAAQLVAGGARDDDTSSVQVFGRNCKAVLHGGNFVGWSVRLEQGSFRASDLVRLGVVDNDVSALTVEGGCTVVIYQHGDFAGWSATLGPGAHDAASIIAAGGRDDDLSSVKIVGEGCTATLYGEMFKGWQVTLEHGEYSWGKLAELGVHNDDTSSIALREGTKAVTLVFDDPPEVSLGIEVDPAQWVVTAVHGDSPAEKHGVLVGDTLVTVDGARADGTPRSEISQLFKHRPLTVTFEREPALAASSSTALPSTADVHEAEAIGARGDDLSEYAKWALPDEATEGEAVAADRDDSATTTSTGAPTTAVAEKSEAELNLNAARDKARQASQLLREAKEKQTELRTRLERDAGDDYVWFPLIDKCVERQFSEYKYKICFYQDAKQSFTSLGKFDRMEVQDKKFLMSFTNGQHCPGGPSRSLKVWLECGRAERIVELWEPSRCTYEARVEVPAACRSADLLAASQRPSALLPHEEL